MLTFPSEKTTLENFGLEHFNINETASIVCRCLLCDGALNVEFDKEYVSLFEPEEEKILSKHIQEFAEKIVSAINAGTLKAIILQRYLDETINKDETYIDFNDMVNWLEERGIELGDLYRDSYMDFMGDTLSKVEECIETEKIKRKNPALYEESKTYDENKTLLLLKENWDLRSKIEKLRNEESAKQPKEVKEEKINPKRKNSLHKLVLAMAIEKYRHDPKAAKNISTTNIENTLLKYGLSIDKNTIREILGEAYEELRNEIDIHKD